MKSIFNLSFEEILQLTKQLLESKKTFVYAPLRVGSTISYDCGSSCSGSCYGSCDGSCYGSCDGSNM